MAQVLSSWAGSDILKVRPKFDPRARFAWAVVLAILLLLPILFASSGLKLGAPEFPWVLSIGVPLIIFSWIIRRAGSEVVQRFSIMLEALTLLIIGGFGATLLQYPMLAIGRPLVDDWLLQADRMLGFDWASFAILFAGPALHLSLFVAYNLFLAQGLLVVTHLSMTGQYNRTWQMLTATLGSLTLTVFFLSLFAADGSFVVCGVKPVYPHVHEGLCAYGPIIHGIKSGAIHAVDASMYLGLASLPSFHVAGGLILVWAVWHSRIWRWPALLLNCLMGIAAVVIAGHYLIDVFGGLLLGALAVFVAKRLLPEHDTPSASLAKLKTDASH